MESWLDQRCDEIEPGDANRSFLVANLVDKFVNAWFHDPVVSVNIPKKLLHFITEKGLQVPDSDMNIISTPIDSLA